MYHGAQREVLRLSAAQAVMIERFWRYSALVLSRPDIVDHQSAPLRFY